MNNENNTIIEIDLLKLLKAVWRQIWAVIIAMAVAGAIAFAYAQYMITPLYKANAMIYVNSGTLTLNNKISISSDRGASKSLVDLYLVILNTRGTLNEVIREAELPYSYGQLQGMIEAASVNSTEIFQIVVTSTDPAEAELIANTVARVLPERISEIMEGSSAKVVEYAVTPASRSFPSLTRYTAIGIAIGAVLSCGFIVLRELLDEQIRSERDLAERYPKVPVLAAIPDMTANGGEEYSSYYAYGCGKSGSGKHKQQKTTEKEKPEKKSIYLCRDMSFSVQEAYKLLRTNLTFSLPDNQQCRVIGITSALRGDGKSTTALNLAYTMAEAGKKVLLTEADLRLPNMANRLNIEKTPGLSNLLAGMAEKERAIRPSGLLNTLDVLAAGDVPPNPSELLGSERMKLLMQELMQTYDYIILDLPPVNAVSDGLIISKLAQGMVLVVRQDYDDFRAVGDAIARMEYLQCKIVGCVLTCVGANSGQYGYRYKRYGKYGGYKRYGYRYGGGYRNDSYSYANYGYGKEDGRQRRDAFRNAVIGQEEPETTRNKQS